MKNIIYILCFLFSFAGISNTITPKDSHVLTDSILLFDEDCDACGCSANGGSIGFSSMLNNRFIGLRYIHQNYKSKEGIFDDSPWTKEYFNTIQLWSRIPISKKTEISALVPYHFNERIKTNDTQQINGIGDITILGFYNLVEKKNDSLKNYQKFQVGAGLKLPTGNYNTENNGSINPSFQLGTGSWDYTLATEYTLQHNKYGINLNANYIIKTENNKKYHFGNQLNYGINLFYNTQIKNTIIVPQIGISSETFGYNKEWGIQVPKTEGNILLSKIGIEIGYNNFSLGTNLMIPITQNLTGKQVEAQYRWAINLNYIL